MSSLKQPLDKADRATMQIWWWLQRNVKDGLVLSLCHAILQADDDALIALGKAHFMQDWRLAEVVSVNCNCALHELGLNDALRTGFSSQKGGGRDFSAMLLISSTNKSIVTVIQHVDEDAPTISGNVEQKVPLTSFAVLKLRDALITAVQAKLSNS
jgi:hypothetical protein